MKTVFCAVRAVMNLHCSIISMRKTALIQKIEALKALQSGQKAWLRDGLTVDLRFSMGSSMAYGAVDYDKMYREADEKMYEDKRMRKKCECS